jgi:hypothetical protein
MSSAPSFDANARLAQIALWLDGGAGWIEQATAQARSDRVQAVTVTFSRRELDTFLSGLRCVAGALMGIAQPVPPPLPVQRRGSPKLRLVKSDAG